MDLICSFPLFTILLGLLSSLICTLLSRKAARRWTLCAGFGQPDERTEALTGRKAFSVPIFDPAG